MVTLTPGLEAHLAEGATTLARCWRITRGDGVRLGFTDHDRNLSFDGTLFEASTGMDAATLEGALGLSVDNSEAVGALSAVGLTEEDILTGRYDDAAVEHWWVNWRETGDRVLILRGTLGEVRQRGNAFEVELRGLSEMLNRPIGRAFSPTCDRDLGDEKCGVDLSDPAFTTEDVVSVPQEGSVVVAGGLDAFEDGWFAYGWLDWLSGANTGARSIIKQDLRIAGTRRLELWEAPALPVNVGDRYRVTAGCDRTGAQCRAKFSNFLNFRGFPHIPGEDWVTAYPRTGDVHEGGTHSWFFHDDSD